MERVRAEEIARFGGRLESLDTDTWLRKETVLTADDRKRLKQQLKELIRIAIQIGQVEIPSTVDQLYRIDNALAGC